MQQDLSSVEQGTALPEVSLENADNPVATEINHTPLAPELLAEINALFDREFQTLLSEFEPPSTPSN